MHDVVVVRIRGGRASGAVVEMPIERMVELEVSSLSVSPAGLLHDDRAGRYVPGAVVVVNPNDPDQAD
jgi:hypothetical protein